MMTDLALNLPGGKSIQPTPGLYNVFLTGSLGDMISYILTYAFGLVGILMFVWAMIGVFQYLWAGGKKEDLAKARSRITWAIVGFLFCVISFALSQYVQQILQGLMK